MFIPVLEHISDGIIKYDLMHIFNRRAFWVLGLFVTLVPFAVWSW